MLDTAHASFVGMLQVPLRHGMTFAELARLGQASLDIDVDLVVVPAAGWRREQWFDDTGLPWVRPSPNMPDLESATPLSGIGTLRGNQPFGWAGNGPSRFRFSGRRCWIPLP